MTNGNTLSPTLAVDEPLPQKDIPYGTDAGLVVNRRSALALGLGAASANLMATMPAAAQEPFSLEKILSVMGDGAQFDPHTLVEVARTLAQRPYVAPITDLPNDLEDLSYEKYIAIRAKPSSYLWRGEGSEFSIEPLHRGFIFTNPVQLYTIDNGQIRKINYARDLFNFDVNKLVEAPSDQESESAAAAPTTDGLPLDFSGFRVYANRATGEKEEVAIFQGATFFRAKSPGQNYGVHAHTLMLRPAEATSDDQPHYRAFWIERPTEDSEALIIHALIDSESVVGIARYAVRPGDTVIIDVETTLIPRVQLNHIGIGGATANFLFNAARPARNPDTRVAVHDVSGLQIHNGRSEWLWRPLDNPQTIQISAFVDANPKGFGLLQRGRDFCAYEDDVQRFERRPSLWIEPLEEWGEGAVQLIEVPTKTGGTPNIISYWRPARALEPGEESRFSWRQYWTWDVPERPKLALARGTRIGNSKNGRIRHFAISFMGDTLGRPDISEKIQAVLSASRGTVSDIHLWPYPDRKMVRVLFNFDPGNESSSELRLEIVEDYQPLSESWLFRWTP